MNKRKRFTQQSGAKKSSKKWCDLCQCWVAVGKFVEGPSTWDQHVNGIKHRRKSASQKHFNNASGRVVSIFEEQPPTNYTSKDPAYYKNIQSKNIKVTRDDNLTYIVKQFQMELVHHLGVSSYAYQNALNKFNKEDVEKVKQKMQEVIPTMLGYGKDGLIQDDQKEMEIVHDNYVSSQAGFLVNDFFNPQLNEAIANFSIHDAQNNLSQNTEGEQTPQNNQFENQKLRNLSWNNSLKTIELVALASIARDLEVFELSVPIQCSTDSNINGANSAATVVLLQELAKNIHVNKLVLRYVLDKGEIAQYAGRQGLSYNGQHRIVTELLKFSEINSTVQVIEVRMPPGGFANVGIDELGQIHQMLQVTANAKLQVLQDLFLSDKSLLHSLPEHVIQKILSLANLQQEQIQKRSFSFELEQPL